MSIAESLSSSHKEHEKEEKDKLQAREFEISLTRCLSNHKVCLGLLTCLQEQLKKYCSDSVVISRMQLTRVKGEYLLRHGISKSYKEETISILQKCDAFSVGFDESEINKTSELEIIVKASDKEDGILLRHYRTLDLFSGTADSIVRSLLGLFDKDGIDYKNKLVVVMTDGCNTMQGHRSGVKKRLTDIVPQCYDLGSCNDHHISNALKHAVESFDSDRQQALVNIYCDLGGAKGRGLKRKKAFEIVCQEKGIIPIPFKQFCSTRFRSVRECLKPVLFNWEALVQYYAKLKSSTDRQKLLKIYFVDREFSSLLELRFINASIRELMEAIDFFEMRSG